MAAARNSSTSHHGEPGDVAGYFGGTSPATSAAPSSASLTISSFTRDFTAMSQLTSLASQGKGLVGVVLPDTVSSARYTEFDAPYLTKAFQHGRAQQLRLQSTERPGQ